MTTSGGLKPIYFKSGIIPMDALMAQSSAMLLFVDSRRTHRRRAGRLVQFAHECVDTADQIFADFDRSCIFKRHQVIARAKARPDTDYVRRNAGQGFRCAGLEGELHANFGLRCMRVCSHRRTSLELTDLEPELLQS